MDYFPTVINTILYSLSLTVIQVLVCAGVGYGFARFQFPFKKILFACVVVMIVLPAHAIMLPLYIIFRNFDPLGLFSLLHMETNLMGTPWPAFIMTILGCGLRSGLYIYIFTQFFRGLPREIEEAAFVDGAGTLYTFLRIMLANAAPAVVTVAVFSLVWQYNDTFFGNLFRVGSDILVSKKLSSLQVNIATIDKILDISIQELYVDAGVVLVMLPVVILYLILQRRFIEGIERSGIVG
jgi:multiple sugar transport system permease protein